MTQEQDGAYVKWSSLPVKWSFLCGEEDVPELRQGFEWWNTKYGNVFVEIPSDESCLCDIQGTSCPDVFVHKDFEDPVLLDAGVRRYAATHVKVLPDAGVGRVRVTWYDNFDEANEFARQTIARHESGHVLGLMHSSYEPCLMYPTVDQDDNRVKDICPGEERLFKAMYGRE